MEKMKILVETNQFDLFIAIDETGWARMVCLPAGSAPLLGRKSRELSLQESWRALDACGDYRLKQSIPVGKLYLKNERIGWEVCNE